MSDKPEKRTTTITHEVSIQVNHRVTQPGIGTIMDGKINGYYLSFVHDREIWKFRVATTQEAATFGTTKEELLFNINSHYVGDMSEDMIDQIIGSAASLFAMQNKAGPLVGEFKAPVSGMVS